MPYTLYLRESIPYYTGKKHDPSFEALLKDAGLLRYWHMPIGTLSQGWCQRLRLCVALCFKKSVIVLDEPMQHLDTQGKTWILKKLYEINEKSNIILINQEKSDFFFIKKKIMLG